MLYDDKFLDNLPEDPWLIIKSILEVFDDFQKRQGQNPGAMGSYDPYIETYVMIAAICEANNIDFSFPNLSGKIKDDMMIIGRIITIIRSELEREMSKRTAQNTIQITMQRLLLKMPKMRGYTFTDGDLKRVQELINELRETIKNASYIDEEHKSRLFKRLEGLQSELHKRVSSLDRLWGFMGDAGVALGKFGKDAKPIFDRAREIAEIAWRTQARSEELESGKPFPLLKSADEDHES